MSDERTCWECGGPLDPARTGRMNDGYCSADCREADEASIREEDEDDLDWEWDELEDELDDDQDDEPFDRDTQADFDEEAEADGRF